MHQARNTLPPLTLVQKSAVRSAMTELKVLMMLLVIPVVRMLSVLFPTIQGTARPVEALNTVK